MAETTLWRGHFLRFGLRALLLLVFLVCVALGLYVWIVQDLRDQQAIQQQLEEIGCIVEWDTYWNSEAAQFDQRPPGSPQWVIDIAGGDPRSRITHIECTDRFHNAEAITKLAAELPYLEAITFLQANELTNEELMMDGFSALPRVRYLRIHGAVVTDHLIHEIGQMGSLRSLTIYDFGNESIEGIQPLAQLKELQRCELTFQQPITDLLATVGEMSSLIQLEIEESRCHDFDFSHLQKLPNLCELGLTWRHEISSRLLEELGKCSQLQVLDLSYGRPPDYASMQGLRFSHLSNLPGLELRLEFTDVSMAMLTN